MLAWHGPGSSSEPHFHATTDGGRAVVDEAALDARQRSGTFAYHVWTRARASGGCHEAPHRQGIMRYVVERKEPFIVPLTHQAATRRSRPPLQAITERYRGERL